MIDGSGALFGTLQGNTREVLHKFTVDLPKKHGKSVGEREGGRGVKTFLYDFRVKMQQQLLFCCKCFLVVNFSNKSVSKFSHLGLSYQFYVLDVTDGRSPVDVGVCVFIFPGRGGQSALRFARLRMEKRHNYVRKVAETAVQLFVSNDKVNVAGMVLAGSADFKTELSQSDMFDPVSRHTP